MDYKAREVAIVGAGLAGMTAALNLARDGKDVLVLAPERVRLDS